MTKRCHCTRDTLWTSYEGKHHNKDPVPSCLSKEQYKPTQTSPLSEPTCSDKMDHILSYSGWQISPTRVQGTLTSQYESCYVNICFRCLRWRPILLSLCSLMYSQWCITMAIHARFSGSKIPSFPATKQAMLKSLIILRCHKLEAKPAKRVTLSKLDFQAVSKSQGLFPIAGTIHTAAGSASRHMVFRLNFSLLMRWQPLLNGGLACKRQSSWSIFTG